MNSGLLIGPLVGILTLLIIGLAIYAFRNTAKRAQAGLPVDWQQRSDAGHVYQLKYRPPQGGKSKRPAMLSLRVSSPSDLDLQIKAESWFDRLAKNLGIAREFQTGDRKFDEALYLRGDIDYRVGMALKQAEVRAPIQQLFAAGCSELRHGQRWLQADWAGFDPAKSTLPGAEAVARLTQLAAALPVRSAAPVSAQRMTRAVLWIVTLVLGCCVVLGIDYPPVRWGQMWRLVLPAALLSWLLLAWVAAWVLRGHSRSHDHWGALILVSLVTCTAGSLGLLNFYNGHYDRSETLTQEVPVADKWTTRHKSRTHYHIGVADWSRPGQNLEFSVDAGEYLTIEPGRSALSISTRRGRLGVEWLQGYHVERRL